MARPVIAPRTLPLILLLSLPGLVAADEEAAQRWIPPERWPMCWLATDLLSERYGGGEPVGAVGEGALAMARGFYEAATKTTFIAGGRTTGEAVEHFQSARLRRADTPTEELERIAAVCVPHQPRGGTERFNTLFPWYAEAVKKLDRERIR